MFPVSSRESFQSLLLENASHRIQFLLFHPSERDHLGCVHTLSTVSSRYLFMRSTSPENHPSSFPLLLTPLDFILLAEGGVPAISKTQKQALAHCKKSLKQRREKKTDCRCER